MTENNEKVIRVGSRKSELALIQTKHVISKLRKLYPERKFEIHTMSTIGDRVLNVSLPKIGEKSLFTRDLEDALQNGGVDFVVHSLKDLPTALPSGMAIGAILEREDSRDALVLNEKYKGHTIDTLPKGCVLGTSSLRRTAQLRRQYPHLDVCDIRGNLNTRLAKLDAPNSKFSGIILAQAGLLRMGWMNRISQVLEPTELLYAVGQGALAVECRANDIETLSMLQNLMCLPTTCKILAERSFLKTLGGGCSAPVAVSTDFNGKFIEDNKSLNDLLLLLTGAVWSLNGQTEIRDELKCSLELGKRKTTESFSTEDELNDEDDISPRKRKRNEDENNGTKVVNDDKFPELNLSGSDDSSKVQLLIDVYGELFKKCPFYNRHQKDKDGGSTSTKKDECPLKIPVGQDFMGKCPYVDTFHKVELAECGKCPITGQSSSTSNTEFERRDQTNEPTKKCPFTEKLKVNELNSNIEIPKECPLKNLNIETKALNNNSNNKSEVISIESCPFSPKTIKMIDYADEEKPKGTDVLPILTDDCKDLFCGIFRHKCYQKSLFAKCDELGRELANNLINKGALEIMKKAQDEIHSNV